MPQFDDLVDDSNKPQAEQKPMMFDDLKEDNSKPKFDDLVDDSEKHSTPGQQVATIAENIGQGISAPLATKFETGETPEVVGNVVKAAPGLLKIPLGIAAAGAKALMGKITPEDISARQSANPGEALAGQVIGNLGLGALSPVGALSSFGARGLKGAIESGAITANDEIGKAMLGHGDPSDAVAAKIAGSTGLGFIAGGLLGQKAQTAGKELKLIQDSKIGSHISDFLSGMGHNAKFLSEEAQKVLPEGIQNKGSFKWGQKLFDALHNKVGAGVAGAVTGTMLGGGEGTAIGTSVGPLVEEAISHFVGPQLKRSSQKYVAPMLLKAASSGIVKNPSQILEHASSINKGDTAISKGIESIFATGSAKAAEHFGSEKDDEKLKEHIEKGGTEEQLNNPQTPAFAEGGEVTTENNEIANHWPEQNLLLSTAKARVSNYLSSLRPSPIQNKLPFDSVPKNKDQEKEYAKAINLANNPLKILNHVKDGTLTTGQMKHFTNMYPEVYQSLSKRMTKKLIEHQMNGEKKPKYKTRQAMSLFLGASLESSMTPQNIMAAQQVFANQRAQMQAIKSKSSALSKVGKNSMTDDQSRERDLNK